MQKTALFTMTAIATAAIVAGRAVGMMTGAHCASGLKAQGVAVTDAAIGEAFAVDVAGTTIAEAGAAIATPGTALKAAADGSGKLIAQAGSGEIIAYSVGVPTAAGQKFEVLLAL